MKKIVYVVESFAGGVYSFLADLCNSLVDEYEIVIIHSLRPDTPKNFEKDFNPKIRFIYIQMNRGLDIFKDIKALLMLKRILNIENPQLIHLHSSKAGFLGRLASFTNGFNMEKVLYNPHGFSFLQLNESKIKRRLFFLLEKFASRLGGIIIGCSKGEYSESIKLCDKSINIDNGIDINKVDEIVEKIKIEKTNENITIATVGRICFAKNPNMFNDIAQHFPHLKFLWIGDGELKHLLTSSNITITGWLNKEVLYRKLISTDIYLMTSLWEGLPISLLEAMYLNKASIVSNVIGNRDVIENYKTGLIANNKVEFIEAINILLNDLSLKKKISKNAKIQVTTRFTIQRMIDDYKKLYLKCLV
ncbi:glycosyltransferase [Clostridium sp. CX1]|uniref:glycosyltransferase n=1 Tax=Clostridium sp. CX1 TaxID=2978346 RepID=UPI0021C1BFD9|nr:glycosyltransferase [Clostridium sp. CX1]MCT8975967.1 glycosyltransferase [Clostridium sp. CX1]